jgi:propanol-preferring alcohol dehydrogenase
MVLTKPGAGALEESALEEPIALPGEVLVRVRACGVCRTDLHVVDGELPDPEIPLVPGHEIVGVIEGLGDGVTDFAVGDRVGIPWLAYVCGECQYCRSGRENLCIRARFTGYQVDGGYADYTVADARFAFKIPDGFSDTEAAPLLCAGLIGYRAYRMAGDARRLGLYGFGGSAHILVQVAVHDGCEAYVFTRPNDQGRQQFALSLGAAWAGGSNEAPPEPLDAAIIFPPVGFLVPEALSHVVPGGVVICAGIHMTDISSFPYRLLWEERIVRSVSNVTRKDAQEFLALAPKVPVKTHVQLYDLADTNRALADLRGGRFHGAAVVKL